jgi:hypothetical protein
MFLTPKLTALLVKTPLGNSPDTYMKPHVIALMVLVNSFTIFRVGLDVPTLMLVTLHLFNI